MLKFGKSMRDFASVRGFCPGESLKFLQLHNTERSFKKNENSVTSKVMIASKWIGLGYEATKVLKIIDLNSSTYYYATVNEDEEKEENGGRSIP